MGVFSYCFYSSSMVQPSPIRTTLSEEYSPLFNQSVIVANGLAIYLLLNLYLLYHTIVDSYCHELKIFQRNIFVFTQLLKGAESAVVWRGFSVLPTVDGGKAHTEKFPELRLAHVQFQSDILYLFAKFHNVQNSIFAICHNYSTFALISQ